MADSCAFPSDTWSESAPQSLGLNSRLFGDAIDELAAALEGYGGTRRLMVVRHGRVAWKGADTLRVHNVWSCTKSFTSTALALLVQDRRCDLQTLAADLVSELSDVCPSATLRHFATMTSGYDAGGAQSDTPFTPTAPLFSPGMRFAYWDSAMNMFARVLTKLAGEPLADLLARRVLSPIGISRDRWQWGDWGELDGVPVNGGAGNKGRGVSMCAEDLARFGLLMLNRGMWDGRQLLETAWVDSAANVQVPPALPAYEPGARGPGTYGYNWWVNGNGPEGLGRWPSAPPRTFAAAGFNNNRCFVVPELDMVIVRLGMSGEPHEARVIWDRFLGHLAVALATT